MYLTVLDESMGCVLGQHDEYGQKEHVIYSLRIFFNNSEIKYSLLEKICYTLAWEARQLRDYNVTHTTLLISKMDPIKYILENPDLMGRVFHWKMILLEYDI